MKKAFLIISIILVIIGASLFALFNYGESYAIKYINKKLEEFGFIEYRFNFDLRHNAVDVTNIDLKGDKATVKIDEIKAEFDPLKVATAGLKTLSIKNAEAEADTGAAMALMALQEKESGKKFNIDRIELENILIKIRGEKNSYLQLKKASIVQGEDTNFKIEVKNFPAHLLNPYLEKQNIYVEGYFTGEIPLIVKQGNIEITNAALQSAGGGVIKYSSAGLKEGNLAMVATLLENFTFKEMRVKANGDSVSDLKINLELRGNNPDFYEGKDVELNINFDGNIIPAIKSSIEAFNFDENSLKNLEKK